MFQTGMPAREGMAADKMVANVEFEAVRLRIVLKDQRLTSPSFPVETNEAIVGDSLEFLRWTAHAMPAPAVIRGQRSTSWPFAT